MRAHCLIPDSRIWRSWKGSWEAGATGAASLTVGRERNTDFQDRRVLPEVGPVVTATLRFTATAQAKGTCGSAARAGAPLTQTRVRDRWECWRPQSRDYSAGRHRARALAWIAILRDRLFPITALSAVTVRRDRGPVLSGIAVSRPEPPSQPLA